MNKVKMDKLPLELPKWPLYDDKEEEALFRCLKSLNWWRMAGEETRAFESEFAEQHGTSYGLAVSNGTHALEVALMACGIRQGDEVIIPAFTFISTAMAVQRVGAIPIPVDVDLDTYCIDIEATKNAINKSTKAIIPVHMGGHGVDMEKLNELANINNIKIIQDAAHAHGAIINNKKIGEWNSMACFSFQNYKLMTAGEGGMIIFPDKHTREQAFLYHNCGRPEGDVSYQHLVLGSNYRLNEFSSAILRVQLTRLDAQNTLREKNASILDDLLKNEQRIITQKRKSFVNTHTHYMYMFLLNEDKMSPLKRNMLVKNLVQQGIPAYMTYKPVYQAKSFWELSSSTDLALHRWEDKCKHTELIANNGVWVHHRALLGNDIQIEAIASCIRNALDEA